MRNVLVISLLAVCIGGVAVADTARESRPFVYHGYSAPSYASHREFSSYVPMSDGTKLAVDVFVPTTRHSERRSHSERSEESQPTETAAFPVILQYTPYRRATINPTTGAIRDLADSAEGKFFLPYGYALVRADMRGTGASTGWLQDFMPQLMDDGKELVDWIAAQPWCDGNVGMMGDSYLGWSQTATASRRPAALKCIVPGVIPLEGFTGEVAPGGIYLQEFFSLWATWMAHTLRNEFLPDQGIIPTRPVVDEDGDGELADEIPLDQNGNGSFVDDGPPTYADGNARADLYYQATMDHHKGNYDYAEWASKIRFIDQLSPLGVSMYDMSPGAHVPPMIASKIPVYNIGGWFDAFAVGSFQLYCTLAPTNSSKLLMGPSYHGFDSGPFWQHFGIAPQKALEMSFIEHLRWFDRYLKGIKNGIDEESPITIFVMNGEGWRHLDQWPPAESIPLTLHFDESNSLSRNPGTPGRDTYVADFNHDSSYGANGGNRYRGVASAPPSELPTRAEQDRKCLLYTSPPLDADLEVVGHPIVELWVSSTADDSDFFVYLEDVDETGEGILITEGQLRAGFAALHDNDRMIFGGVQEIEVLPELPWHGFEKKDYNPAVLAGDAVVKLVIDFHPSAWVFRKGHAIRIAIACADYPTFALHPRLSPSNNPEDESNILPTIYVHRTSAHGSSLILPTRR